jgi:hypothetical protein
MLNNPLNMEVILASKLNGYFLPHFSCFGTRSTAGNCQTGLVDESEMIRNQMGRTIDQK